MEEKKVRTAISDDTLERVVGGVSDPCIELIDSDSILTPDHRPRNERYDMGKSYANGGGIGKYH